VVEGITVDISLSHRRTDGWDIVDVQGDVDLASAPVLRTRLDDLLTSGSRRILVNLEGVSFMDSSGLNAIVAAMRGVREVDGEIAVVCTNETILKILSITGIDRLLTVHPTVDRALAS
jgi:anti-sigma B factor antagonist